ncbi:ParB/RepB/Spo0J family partition protein [Dyella sp. 2RAF44]|uniref:ParB/RepB/Spo0J family partition protein n=1 Tax=Dyella sp. 2RAF44 TaxID=3233000 RepID=UPI003F90C7AE
MSSFKQMVKDGTIKRADAMKVRLADIHVEPGFNERTPGAELDAYIEQMVQYILDGGTLPPLEVRPRVEGGVWLVDGHCRTESYNRAAARGAAIEWLEVRAFVGNDADRVARIVSSNTNRPLTPLETSRVYKKLRAFGKSPADIATMVGRTRTHVDQMLLLADANTDVQQMVEAGEVSATNAVNTVRKHGENAGHVLGDAATRAKAAGKAKVTAGTIEAKGLPRKVLDGVVARVEAFTAGLPKEARMVLHASNPAPDATVTLPVALVAEFLHAQTAIADARDKQETKAREKAAKAAQTDLAA